MKRPSLSVRAGALLVALVVLSGCSSLGGGRAADDRVGSGPETGVVQVVASTNVYGDIVKQIGGDSVEVTSILSEPRLDPHGFEADASAEAAIARAQLIVENGGGYDDFVDRMRSSTGSKAPLVNAVRLSGFDVHKQGFNEHVFFHYPTMGNVAAAVGAELSSLQPGRADEFAGRVAAFRKELAAIEQQLSTVKSGGGGAAAYTEAVAGYLFSAAGLTNQTPAAFSDAIEDGQDVPPAALHDTLQLLSSKAVRVLAYNEQSPNSALLSVRRAADEAGVPVIGVSEILPPDTNYQTWQQRTVDALKAALAR